MNYCLSLAKVASAMWLHFNLSVNRWSFICTIISIVIVFITRGTKRLKSLILRTYGVIILCKIPILHICKRPIYKAAYTRQGTTRPLLDQNEQDVTLCPVGLRLNRDLCRAYLANLLSVKSLAVLPFFGEQLSNYPGRQEAGWNDD